MCREARLARWFGLDRDNRLDFRSGQDIVHWGFKFHMNDVAASIGLGKLSARPRPGREEQGKCPRLL